MPLHPEATSLLELWNGLLKAQLKQQFKRNTLYRWSTVIQKVACAVKQRLFRDNQPVYSCLLSVGRGSTVNCFLSFYHVLSYMCAAQWSVGVRGIYKFYSWKFFYYIDEMGSIHAQLWSTPTNSLKSWIDVVSLCNFLPVVSYLSVFLFSVLGPESWGFSCQSLSLLRQLLPHSETSSREDRGRKKSMGVWPTLLGPELPGLQSRVSLSEFGTPVAATRRWLVAAAQVNEEEKKQKINPRGLLHTLWALEVTFIACWARTKGLPLEFFLYPATQFWIAGGLAAGGQGDDRMAGGKMVNLPSVWWHFKFWLYFQICLRLLTFPIPQTTAPCTLSSFITAVEEPG